MSCLLGTVQPSLTFFVSRHKNRKNDRISVYFISYDELHQSTHLVVGNEVDRNTVDENV